MTYPRFATFFVPLTAAGLVLGACSSSGSSVSSGSAPTSTLPTLSSTPTTLHLFLNSQQQGFFGPDGKPITDQNAPPAAGDYFNDFDVVYMGTHTRHDAAPAGSAHLICVVGSVSGQAASAACNGLVDLGGSMLVADHQAVQLSQNSGVNLSITGGTGRYRGAQGSVVTTQIPSSNNSDLTVTVSRPSGKPGPTPAPSGSLHLTSTPQALHYYSVDTEDTTIGPDGKPITDPNAQPKVGDVFTSTDEDYAGTHTRHGKQVVATDHIVCVLTAVSADNQGGTGLCDGAFALGNSLLVAERQTVQFSSNQNTAVSITGGTDGFLGAHGSVQSTSLGGNSNNSDVVVTVSK